MSTTDGLRIPLPPIRLPLQPTVEQQILACLERIETRLVIHFDGDAKRPPVGKHK